MPQTADRSFPTVAASVARTFVLAYKENTDEVCTALTAERLPAEVLRPTYTAEQLTYSRTIRCLLNHAGAWERALNSSGLTLIVEADFVPCRGMGALPMPFHPERHGDSAWAYLYSAAPRIFRRYADGTLPGHSATSVAYVVSPRVAGWLCDYTKEELIRHADLTAYSLWDTQFQWHIMGRGATCFMPFRNYGEHGGMVNPEHARAGTGFSNRIKPFRRLSKTGNHHADVLYGPLRFLPLYSRGSRGRFWRVRAEAKLVGWLKLLTGRIAMPSVARLSAGERIRLFAACARRLCSLY